MLLELRDPGRSELAEFASCEAAWSRLPNLPYVPQCAQAASSLSGMAARKASEAAIATAQNALTAVAVPSGAYGAYESFRRNNYATGLFSVVMTALGAYSLAQGANGQTGGRRFAAGFDSLSDAENDIRNPAEQFRIDSANSPVDASPAINAPPGVDIQANIRAAQQHRWDLSWFRAQVQNRGPWDYKQLGRQYADFGNFNYGATGKAAGIPEGLLLRSAGWAQIQAGTSRPEWGTPGFLLFGGSGSFGDDPIDQFWIRSGFRYHDTFAR